MNEHEIGPGLARLAAQGRSDVDRQLARNMLQRDRRRMGLLAALAVLFWAIAAAGVLFVVYVAIFRLYPRQQKLMHDQALGNLPAQQLIEIQAFHFQVVQTCTLVVAAAFISATLAAGCTLLLIFLSRRATLSQINANLAEILEHLQQHGPKSP
jgi:hypothetical protein